MPLHLAPRVLAIAIAGMAAAAVANADDRQVRSITEPSRPAARYFDIEVNKAASVRTLGLHFAEQRLA